MGKKDKTKKGKGAEPELSKKDRKKLEQRAEKIAAELAEREAAEAKAAKKAGKKAKSKKHDVDTTVADSIATAVIPDEVTAKTIAAADKVLADKGAPEVVKDKARKIKAKAEGEVEHKNRVDAYGESDQEAADRRTHNDDVDAIKARVKDKAAARQRLDDLDRDDEDAVRAFNETDGKLLGHYATYTGEVEETLAKMDRTEQRKKATAGDEPAPAKQDVEEVVTEEGRVFEAGAASAEGAPVADVEPEAASERAKRAIEERGFALPSEASPDFETNGLGQYKVKRPSDGKLVGYTRTTTFIDAIDDKTQLVAWKLRTLLEGVVTNEEQVGSGKADDLLMSKVRDALHTHDVALAKARKAKRKGKLVPGELADIEKAAAKTFKGAVEPIVDQLLELGGVHAKANKGTDIHALCQLYDQSGMDAVSALLTAGTIDEVDFADVEAYARALEAAGIKHVESEVMVVNDDAKRAGRLDSIKLVRFPGTARAVRVVADIKTGSVEFGTKIPMQLESYAGSKGYDPAKPDARRDLKLSRTKGLLIHLPQGTGTCFIYPVDLATGRIGNKIATEVREFRSAGKKGIDFKTDLATGIAFAGDPEAVS